MTQSMYRWVLSWGRGAEPAPGQREEGAEGAELGTWAESTSLWKVGVRRIRKYRD